MLNYYLTCSIILCIFLISSHQIETKNGAEFKTSPANSNSDKMQRQRDEIFLESMEDLEHIAYLSMRNFNMTDNGLLQSSWLYGLSSNNYALAYHKQHQKVASFLALDKGKELSASALSSASILNSITNDEGNLKERLALMLESFIAHLRNGHLRRLSLSELELIVNNLNKTYSLVEEAEQQISNSSLGAENSGSQFNFNLNFLPAEQQASNSDEIWTIRCNYLVIIYKYELLERSKQQAERHQPDFKRLHGLCELVVRCNSAEDLVNLIRRPWRPEPDSNSAELESGEPREAEVEQQRLQRLPNQELKRKEKFKRFNGAPEPEIKWSGKSSLRDSLSLSLAKLCPLILFQLHDEEGLCSVRKDDRPPMVTVWGFATLFVTIVSFCSLIGLSITPLLRPTRFSIDDSRELDEKTSKFASTSNSSKDASTNTSEPSTSASNKTSSQFVGSPSGPNACPSKSSSGSSCNKHLHTLNNINMNNQNKACLTLFEGLAVGSLVGSALFSLIPQAFELQERESNQGFLLKALIIFFGIYLFFCSERIMRIILDTRQKRKKLKTLHNINHRSSNSIPPAHHHALLPAFTGSGPGPTHNQRRANHSWGAAAMASGDQGELGRRMLRFQQPVKLSMQPASIPLRARRQTQQLRLSRQVGADQKMVNFSSQAKASKLPVLAAYSQEEPHPALGSKTDTRRRKSTRRKTRKQLRKGRQFRRKFPQQLPLRHNESDDNEQQANCQHQLTADGHLNRSSSSLSSIRVAPKRSSVFREDKFSNLRENVDLTNSNYDDDFNENSCNDDGDWTDSDEEGLQMKMLAVNQQMMIRTGQPVARPIRYPLGPGAQPGHLFSGQNFHLYPSNNSNFLSHHAAHASGKPANRATLCTGLRVKQDISTVAWMIILGDGLHNFIDGISIGAAFSESILSGVSISVAVICEEFPHELGDFAILVSSGMTVRQALGYNFLSACTCYFGMAVGIILGDVNDSASYISALAAGVFLYIALVDMMGELSATLEETSRDSIARTLKLLLLQNVGIFIGISIIFILSFIDF